VDLPAFPDKLAALLRLCDPPAATAAAESIRSATSQFSARLDGSSGIFSIIESNEFKNLTHISLQMRPANDATLKAYLSSRLMLASNLSIEQAKQIDDLQRSAADLSRQLGAISEELTDARYVGRVIIIIISSLFLIVYVLLSRNRLSHDAITADAAHTREVSELRASAAAALQRAQAEAGERLAALQAQTEAVSSELRAEVASLRKELSSSVESRTSAEYRVKELEREVRVLSGDCDRFRTQSESLSEDMRARDTVLMRLERDNSSLKTKVEGMQQQLVDKDEVRYFKAIHLFPNLKDFEICR
jgi:spindle assembly abnormal protein 6